MTTPTKNPRGNPAWFGPDGKGRSGNPGGSHRLKIMTEALRKNLEANPDKVEQIANQLITMALSGDLDAIKLMFDRLEGKAVQSLEVAVETNVIDRTERMARLAELQAKLSPPPSGTRQRPN